MISKSPFIENLINVVEQQRRDELEQTRLEKSIPYRAGRGFREMATLVAASPRAFSQAAVDFWLGISGR